MDFPKPRGYSDGDIISFISAAAKFCRKNSPRSAKFFFQRMDKRDAVLLLETLPNAITYYLISKRYSNLPELVADYLSVLKVMVKVHSEHQEPVHKIMPQLRWIVNAVSFSNLNCDGKANAALQSIADTLQSTPGFQEPAVDVEDQPPEDYRRLSVVPRQCDVIDCPTPYIRRNILHGPYDSVQHYLDVNFRMMREDMLRSFRACIKICKLKLLDLDCADMTGHMFTKVSVGFPPRYTLDGAIYEITVRSSQTEWNPAKDFRPGSLVCLSHDRFDSVTFVCIREKEVTSDEEIVLQVAVEHVDEELSHKSAYVLLEADVYFEPYRHVLQAMKLLDEESFPLANSIVYLDHDKISDSQPVAEAIRDDGDGPKRIEAEAMKQILPEVDPELDEDQMKAFHLAITEKLALIHGPPGTGKTHLGCKIVQALLDNDSAAPVMVCCATNQTLDKFLEKLLKRTRKIIRLGGQSISEALKPHTMSNMTEAIRLYRSSGEKSLKGMDPIHREAYELTRKLCPDLFSILPKTEVEARRNNARSFCESLNHMYSLYASCKYTYLDDVVLNKIIPPDYKEKILNGAGTRANVLSRCLIEWLLLYRQPTDPYEKCNEAFAVLSETANEGDGNGTDSSGGTDQTTSDSEEVVNIWRIPVEKRFALLYDWRKKLMEELRSKIEDKKVKYGDVITNVQRTVHCSTAELLQRADVIGMTTCGAAKFKNLVLEASPKVLIVEEAAEIFESHVISALVPTVKRLILIGDHEQLRPLTATLQMGRDYFLNVSMFERLLKNGAPSVRLTQQYRMRPSIARLLVPEFYESLTSHQSVYRLPDVSGTAKNVFFLQHCEWEERCVPLRLSTNEYEGKFVAKLYEYLLEVGYKSSQITILTTYNGQIEVILKYSKYASDGVQIFTVDGYQGEENDIVLVSFVRSNESGQIGFVSQSNRVCVALSRARMGLYCVGNFEQFAERSDLWEDLLRKLRVNQLIGTRFPIRCPNHGEVIHVEHPDEFEDFLRRGCGEECGADMSCGHRCQKKCHFDDPDHDGVKCTAPCRRFIQVEGKTIPCRKECWEKCQKPRKLVVVLSCGHEIRCTAEEVETVAEKSLCKEEVPVILECGHLVSVACNETTAKCKATVLEKLGCGHTKLVSCHQKSKGNATDTCSTIVSAPSPCGHVVDVQCSLSENFSDLPKRCKMPCGVLLECGHPCVGWCSECYRLKIHEACRSPCELTLPCGHECEGLCNAPCPDCSRPCDLRCSHSTCPNPCVRPCVKCTKPCQRGCEEHRACAKRCWETCLPCGEKCRKELPCGHQCIGLCGQPCPDLCRYCDASKLVGDDIENDSFVMLEDCCHVVTVDSLGSVMENAYLDGEWPCCEFCETPIRRNVCYDGNLKDLKSLILEKSNVGSNYQRMKYLYESVFGSSYIIRKRFQDVCRDVSGILDSGRRHSCDVFIISHCLRALVKLDSMDDVIDKYAPCLDARSEELTAWIRQHLQGASYQQLEELYRAVDTLEKDLDNFLPGAHSKT